MNHKSIKFNGTNGDEIKEYLGLNQYEIINDHGELIFFQN